MEWIGSEDGVSSPQLHSVKPTATEAKQLYTEVADAIVSMAKLGYAHGDLSPFNILVRDGHVVIIDLPQVVDLAKNPMGMSILERDCINVCQYFAEFDVIKDHTDLFTMAVSAAWSI